MAYVYFEKIGENKMMYMHKLSFIHGAGGVAILLVTMFVGYFIFYRHRHKKSNADKYESLEILKLRVAKGEITLDEFNTIKQVL